MKKELKTTNGESKFRHVGIVVENLQEAVIFYTKYFQFKHYLRGSLDKSTSSRLLALPYDLEYVKLCLDEDTTVLELYYIKDCLSLVHEKIFNHFAITVKSAYKTYRQMLNVKGVEILSEPELDKQKTHKLFFIRDPWSNLIEIVENLK